MEIKRNDDGKKGTFTAHIDGEKAGFMAYSWAGDRRIIIEHTEVAPEFGEQGIGRKLVMAGVAFAREKGLKIVPLCPYAKRVFEKTEAIQDVLS